MSDSALIWLIVGVAGAAVVALAAVGTLAWRRAIRRELFHLLGRREAVHAALKSAEQVLQSASEGEEAAKVAFALDPDAEDRRVLADISGRMSTLARELGVMPLPRSLVHCADSLAAAARLLGERCARVVERGIAAGFDRIASELGRLNDTRAVVEVALRHALSVPGAVTGSVMLLDETSHRLRIVTSVGLPNEVIGQRGPGEGDGIAGLVLSTRQPLLVEDPGSHPTSGRRHGVRSAASVPIADDEGVLGVLNVGSRAYAARLTESHVESLQTLGRLTAAALRATRAPSTSWARRRRSSRTSRRWRRDVGAMETQPVLGLEDVRTLLVEADRAIAESVERYHVDESAVYGGGLYI